jgi:hypothetical protein
MDRRCGSSAHVLFPEATLASIASAHGSSSRRPVRRGGLLYLIGFKQRVTTLLHWTISFIGGGRAERAITRQQVVARRALDTLTPAQSGRPDRVRFPRR